MTKQLRLLTMAAMMLLAACDEGSDTVAPGVTGSVAGTVTIDGAGAAGVVVTLSSGKTATTSATGTYTIADVAAGAYTVTISGAPADVAFPATTQAAVVATAGQVVTVNFAGSRIRTSAVFGSVTSGSGGLAGITVTLTGPETKTATTDANGQFSAAGLRAGTYTVAISGMPSTVTCATTSQSVTVGAGESKVAAFACAANATAKISGTLYIDENNQNLLYDGAALESTLAAANVAITLEGPTIGLTQTKQTDATGAFSFTGLAAGSYNVTIASADPDLPVGYAYAGVAPGNTTAVGTVVLAAGGSGTINYAFRITRQTIKAYAFLGRDVSPAPAGISTSIPRGVAPVSGVILDLYPTEADALGATNRLSRDTTDVGGEVQFNFLRTADTSPGGPADQIVFAQYVSGPNAEHTLNGETRLEIKYNNATATGLAADTFDLLNTRSTFAFDAVGSTGTALAGWSTALWINDTSAVASQTGTTNAAGRQVFTDAMAVASLPDTFYMRLSGTQAAAGTHAFVQNPVAQRGTVVNKYLRWIHNGTTTVQDTVDVGDEIVSFADADLVVRVYHERDDTTAGGPPKFTAGDNIENADNIQMTLKWRQAGAATDSTRTVTATAATGLVTFLNIPVNQGPYTLNARSLVTNQVVLNDTTVTVGQGGANGDLSGGVLTTRVYTLGANSTAGHAAFAFKYNNGYINGRVKAADSTGAAGLIVSLTPAVGNIQGSTARTDTTDATGLFGWTGLREGKYTVSVAGNATWQVVTPAVTDTLQNNGDIDILNFIVRRLDTSIKGVVVNDRDADNVVDVGDALPGVTMTLYRDGSGAITLDTLVTTTVTDVNGAYQFNALPEGRYIVKATQPAGTAVVMSQGFTAAGVPIDTTVATTAATTTGEGANNTRTVGTITPVPLPAWNYSTSTVAFNGRTHFTFLFNNTRAFGVITMTAGGAPVPNMSVTLRRCLVSAGAVKPPAGPALCTTYMPLAAPNAGPTTITTDATGTFNYNNLQEGVYEIVPNAASVGLTGTTPTSRLFLQSGNQDIERGDFSAF